MSDRFKLSIDNPCSQKWSDFEDRGDRGYCSSCQKEVVDFTRMGDSEIRAYFENRPKNVCGQFKPYQLRTYSNPVAKPTLSKWLSWPIAASALLFTTVSTNAQEKDKKELSQLVLLSESGPKNSNPREVVGTVTDENGEGLPGVNVVIKGTTRGVTTDLDGNYRIQIPNNTRTLVFSFVGMITTEVEIVDDNQIDATIKVDHQALNEVVYLGGVCVSRWYSPRGLYSRTRGFFRRIF